MLNKYLKIYFQTISWTTQLFQNSNLCYLLLFSFSVISDNFVTPWTVACQTTICLWDFPGKNTGPMPIPSPGDHPNPGIELVAPEWQASSLPLSRQRSPALLLCWFKQNAHWPIHRNILNMISAVELEMEIQNQRQTGTKDAHILSKQKTHLHKRQTL